MEPVLQLALDFVDMHRALGVAREAVLGGADWLEVGTPLLKAEGLDSVRRLREEFPNATLESIAVCQRQFLETSPRMQRFLRVFG